MPFNQIATSVTIINSGLSGYQALSFTEFETSAISAIAAGSCVEIGGAFFKATEDITINASSWSAITTATGAFVSLTPSGTAGSQIITAAWITTDPVWVDSKQGYYASAGSISRIVAGAFKTGATSMEGKNYLTGPTANSTTHTVWTAWPWTDMQAATASYSYAIMQAKGPGSFTLKLDMAAATAIVAGVNIWVDTNHIYDQNHTGSGLTVTHTVTTTISVVNGTGVYVVIGGTTTKFNVFLLSGIDKPV